MFVHVCPECRSLLLIPGPCAGTRIHCPTCAAALDLAPRTLPADEPLIVWQRRCLVESERHDH